MIDLIGWAAEDEHPWRIPILLTVVAAAGFIIGAWL